MELERNGAMRILKLMMLTGAGLGLGGCVAVQAQEPAFDYGQAAFERHVSLAAAGMPEAARPKVEQRCRGPQSTTTVNAEVTPPPQDISAGRVTPTRVFDNLYFVGDKDVSVWALNTSDGIILFDATHDILVEDRVVSGLKALGFDPARIKYVVVTHGHADHYGGAKLLQERYGARVLMGEPDWNGAVTSQGTVSEEPLPRRDISVSKQRTLQLGDTVVTIVPTPGHTPGTLSMLFPVFDGDERHMVMLVGGGHPFGSVPAMKKFVTFVEPMAREAKARGVDLILSNHPKNDETLRKLERLAARKPGEPNPFVMGVAATNQLLTMVTECGRAWIALQPQ